MLVRALSIPVLRGGIIALAAAALLTHAPAHAQTQTQQLPDSIRELVEEFQQKQARLQEVQVRALEGSEELQQEQAELGEKVEAAMAEIDPGYEQRIERLEEIRVEAQEAQAGEDQEAISSLVTEAQELQARIVETRDQALEREAIQTDISDFQEKLLEEMIRLDPEVETVVERLEELAERLGG